MKNRKILLIVIGIVVIIAILALVLILTLSKKTDQDKEENNIDVEQLEINFDSLFDNSENEYVKTLYHIVEEKSGEYKISADIPHVNINSEIDSKINREINDVFAKKILKIIDENEDFTKINIDYMASVNENVVSLAIKCVLKEGNTAQRTIIKTYNYDVVNQRQVKIMDMIQQNKKEGIQNQINSEIEKQIKKEEMIIKQGYNVYRRDKNSDMYILENATEFYIRDDILYIIYSYGNNNYTSEIDLIINKI